MLLMNAVEYTTMGWTSTTTTSNNSTVVVVVVVVVIVVVVNKLLHTAAVDVNLINNITVSSLRSTHLLIYSSTHLLIYSINTHLLNTLSAVHTARYCTT